MNWFIIRPLSFKTECTFLYRLTYLTLSILFFSAANRLSCLGVIFFYGYYCYKPSPILAAGPLDLMTAALKLASILATLDLVNLALVVEGLRISGTETTF